MNRSRIKRSTAIVLLLAIVGIFLASVIAGISGNTPLFLGLFVFDGFFTVIVYFALQIHRNVKDADWSEGADEHQDEDDTFGHSEYDLDADSKKSK